MKFSIFMSLISSLFLFESCTQSFTDINYFDLKDKVKQQTISIYFNPKENNGKWETESDSPNIVVKRNFNIDGCLTLSQRIGKSYKDSVVYIIKSKQKIEGISMNANEAVGKFNYIYTNNIITQKEYDKKGILIATIISTIENKKVKEEDVKLFLHGENKPTDHFKNVFYNDSNYIQRYESFNFYDNSKDTFDMHILEKDTKGNPLKIIKTKNGKPTELQLLNYIYY